MTCDLPGGIEFVLDAAPSAEVHLVRGLLPGRSVQAGEVLAVYDNLPTRKKRLPVEVWLRRLMYVRIPLWEPDAFLSRTIGVVRHLAGSFAWCIYLTISMVGLALLVQQFDAYCSTFPFFFNARGIAAFGSALVGVKCAHELSHAYTAKALGNRVPSLGVALIFMFPVAYSDVTDSWRMSNRRKRLLIGLAGVVTELVIAGLALFIWALSPPGICKSICFVVSSATILSTILVNMNPAMRFDGYYLLSDLLGIDNLQSRSFAVTRWACRRHLLGMKCEAPEVIPHPQRLIIMIAYSLCAWIYRVFLFLAIALMLYYAVAKIVGVVLCLVTIYSFLGRPIVLEVATVARMWRRQGGSLRISGTMIALSLVLVWGMWPVSRWEAAPAVTTPRDAQTVYTPGGGMIGELRMGLGQIVHQGQTLFVIDSVELATEATLADLDVQRVELELALIKSDVNRRALLPQKVEELARSIATREAIRTTVDGHRIEAQVDGVIAELDESVHNGTYVGTNQVLGKIVSQDAPRIVCYVRHELMLGVSQGDRVSFTPKARPSTLWGTVLNVDPLHTAFLEYEGLSSIAGGEIAVTPDGHGRLEIVDSYYEVEVALDTPAPTLRLGQTGSVWLRSTPRSYLGNLIRHARRVLIRESSF